MRKKGAKNYHFLTKPRPIESLWKTLPGLRRALSLKLGKFVKIGSEKMFASLRGEAGSLFKGFKKPMKY